jgi:predicted enzyme related to lactoylglutathione lyase
MSDPSVRGIGQIHLTVADVEVSLAFYRDVLGMTHLFTVPARPPGQAMAFLDAGGVRLYLGAAEDGSFASRPLVYYRVDDVGVAFAAVTARGAEAVAPPHVVHRSGSHELWMAFVADPDGIRVGLMAEVPLGT